MPHCLIHDPCAFPVEREIRIWRKVDEPRAEIAERLGTTERSIKRVVMKTYEQLRLRLDPELLGDLADGSE